MLNLDFSDVKDQKVLEEGLYNVIIKKVEEKDSSNGNPMLFVVFEEAETGSAVFENYVLTTACMWKVKELLTAAGIDCSETVEFDPQELVGIEFKAKIIQEDYQGSPKNRIKKIFEA